MAFFENIREKKYLQWVLILIGLILIGVSSERILHLPLWLHWPLIWLFGFWVLFVGIFWKRIAKSDAALERFGFSTFSGVLLAAAFPMSQLTPIIFCAFVPLLTLHKRHHEISYWKFFWHLYNAFFIWNIFTTYWVLNTSFAPGIVANIINTGLMTIPWLLFKKVNKRVSLRNSLWALAAFWISFEYIHYQWEISWPWLNIGHTFAIKPEWVQWYSWTGVFGGALWIWWINIFIFYLLGKETVDRKNWLKLAGGVFGPIFLSLIMYATYQEEGQPAEVIIVQPNYEPHYEKFDIPMARQLEKMSDLAWWHLTQETDFLLYPETVINSVKLNNLQNHRGIQMFSRLTEEFPNLQLISGISSFRTYEKDSLLNRGTRTHINANGDTTFWDVQNSAMYIAEGEVKDAYFKSKLVPGAEIFPYREWLPFLKPIVDQLQGSVEGLVVQDHRQAFGRDGFKVAPVICYESIYGEYVSEYIKEGANAIFIMTNDGWWDDTPGHEQHLQFARLRAIEQRKSIARAANTGISCFINQRGDILQQTAYGEDASIKGEVLFNDKRTIYNKYGDAIAYAAMLFSIFFLLAGFLPKIFRKY